MKIIITGLSFLLLIMSHMVFAQDSDVTAEQRVERLELTLVNKGEPQAAYVYAVRTGNLLFLAGHISVDNQGKPIVGKLGDDMSTESGALAARAAGISILATIKQQLGSLNRVKKFVKVTGMVNATADFTEHSQVVNGFSNLMIEVFGENGKHARSAVGMSSLPVGAAVEIEVILEVQE